MNNTSDQNSENELRLTQILVNQQQLFVQKYLESPFSISWSKLAVLLG